MCLIMGLVSRHEALLMSDGFVMQGDMVLLSDASKIFPLPSGDRIIATGTDEGIRFIQQLQREEAKPAAAIAQQIKSWGEAWHPDRNNYFALIGRQNGALYVWRGRLSCDGWEEIVVNEFESEGAVQVLIDGYLVPPSEDFPPGKAEANPYRDSVKNEVKEIINSTSFAEAADKLRNLFQKVYRDCCGRIGGQIFTESMSSGPATPKKPAAARLSITDEVRGWECESATQKNAAVDSLGNLLLKNIAQGVASTAGPTTTSSTMSVIPEMSQTITTKGNRVLVVFNGTFQVSVLAGLLEIAIFRDGTQVGYLNLTSAPGASYFFPSSISWIDSPSAGSHSYDVRWSISSGQATGVGTDRALQVVELG